MKIKKSLSIITLTGVLIINAASYSFSQSSEGNRDVEVKEGDTSVYTIIKGDTLWDISGDFLKNPFLWPNIWENNKYIKNPDLIFPGKKLIIPSVIVTRPETGQEAATDEAPASAAEATLPEQAATEPGEESPLLLPPDIAQPPHKRTAGPAAPSVVKPAIAANTIEAGGHIIINIESYGVIKGAREDRTIFAQGDIVYLDLSKVYADKVSLGQKFTIFRTSGPVIHPITKKKSGYLFIPIGVVEINRLQGYDASGMIIRSYNYTSIGDQIQPYIPAQPVNEISKSSTEIEGYIIEAQEKSALSAQYSVVYVDKGAADGIIPGTILYVTGDRKDDVIAELRVLSVQDNTSAAFVKKSAEPFGTGSKVTTVIK